VSLFNTLSQTAEGWIGTSLPGINVLLLASRKSKYPLWSGAIIGLPVVANYANGRQYPSPCVNVTIVLILGWLYNSFISYAVNYPCNKYTCGIFYSFLINYNLWRI